jgi:N-carbamoylputrescine amidase
MKIASDENHIRVACIQISTRSDDVKANRESIVDSIRKSISIGAKVLLLPELCSIPYILPTQDQYRELAEPSDGPTIQDWLVEACNHEIYIIGGFLEREHRQIFNSAALIGPKGVIGIYRKTHLWEHEKLFFEPGNHGIPVWETAIGRIGILICFDIRFPECARVLALKGADLICIPVGWSNIVKKNQIDCYGFTQANYQAIAQANCNKVAIMCANRAGKEGPHEFVGKSLIVDASGQIIAGPASSSKPEILCADINLNASRNKGYGTQSDLFKDRRIDLYGEMLGYRDEN